MGASRRALLVAVPQYELSDRFPDLTRVVQRDVEVLGDALRSSGYAVEVIGTSPDAPALRSRIRSAVGRVCATAPEDGTVLVHFTGHGMSVDGSDHLVPADAQLSWASDPPDVDLGSLIDLDLSTLLKGCRAGTVLLTVDACRGTDESGTGSHGGPATNFPSRPERVAVLFGCGAGQVCGSDDESGSHFTRALADALHADTSPRSVADVIAHTARRTAEFARAAGAEQNPRTHYAPGASDAAVGRVDLCAGRTLQEDWTLAVRDPDLWAAVPCDDERRAGLQKALVRLAEECAQWRTAGLAGVTDPWADDGCPVRVLTRGLRPLLAPSLTRGGPLLDAAEFAILAAAPFVREAVHAMGVKETGAARPFALDQATDALARDPERVDLEHTFAAHSLLWRKGRELAGRTRAGAEDDARAVAAWLLHRHAGAKEELWDVYAPQLLTPLAQAMIGADAAPARIGELTDELVRICRQTGVVPARRHAGDQESAGAGWRLDEIVYAADRAPERWRPRDLSWLIGVAGLLGGDLRELPGVLVDNIGVTDGLVPAQAVAGIREVRWALDPYSRTLDLDLPCPHPAVHAALEVLTGWADDAVQRIREHTGPTGPTGLLAHLPDRVTCRKLRPQYDPATKGDMYGVPLMRFGLAEDEMRELLMGTQLYGDRTLALRELYQNALDACRYRQARLRYGKADKDIPYRWDGEIVFRQGVDGSGRRYVECEDNGVGMGRETLRGTFARAGRRFEQSREYRREQARWRRADPELRIFPNSRFGVGVFSYFMLADEISIWTRGTDEYGRAESGQGLRVDIASSGSLFRIKPSEESQPTGGTRVRLYLQSDDDFDTAGELGKRIWRTDFAMRVEDGGRTVRTWEAEALYYRGDATTPVRAADDLWWVPGGGHVLADGVLVEETETEDRYGPVPGTDDVPRDADDVPYGCVVDLRASHAPEISTSRNAILSYDRAYVKRQVLDACAEFRSPDWFTLEWLWFFALVMPEAAERIAERLLAADARISSELCWEGPGAVEFRRIGFYPDDRGLVGWRGGRFFISASFGYTSTDERVLAWRAGVLAAARIELDRDRVDFAVPDTVEGYPEPALWESRDTDGYTNTFDKLFQALLSRARDEPCTVGVLLRRLRRYAIMGMVVPAVPDPDLTHRWELDATDCGLILGNRFPSLWLDQWREGMEPLETTTAWSVLSVLGNFAVGQRLPVREALDRARRFASVGFAIRIPDTVSQPPDDLVVTEEELSALYWHPEFSGPHRQFMHELHRPSDAEFTAVLRRHSWLGLSETPAARGTQTATGPATRNMTPEEDTEFERVFGGRAYSWLTRVTIRQLVHASGVLSLSLTEVVEKYAHALRGTDLRLPDPGELGVRVFSRLDSELLTAARADRIGYGEDDGEIPAPLLDTAVAVRRVQADADQVTRALAGLADAGLVDPRAVGLVEQWRALPSVDMKLLPEHGGAKGRIDLRFRSDEVELPADPAGLTTPYAVAAAAAARATLGTAFARLPELAALTGLTVADLPSDLPAGLAGLRPSSSDVLACCTVDDRTVRWRAATPTALIEHARHNECTLGESITALSRYAPLGGSWRLPADGDATDGWSDHRPTAHDTAAFADDLIGDRPAHAMDLLRVAARFGWRLDRTWDQLAYYRPFGLDLRVARPDVDVIPTWRDLILLSEHYTGRAPAITGEVAPERIGVSARELERSTRWVGDRLALYKGVFGLTLPRAYPANPAPTPPPEPYRPTVATARTSPDVRKGPDARA
ncbi:caspase family protein [Streptomyces sp. NPDC058001]|uniref:HD domain-containing protein n=1 Tax=Streptomyces sp. NPDC058001 TaxID=3346300 RepID=UPI0036E5C525